MRSTRQITLIILLTVLISPGLLFAAPAPVHSVHHDAARTADSAAAPQLGIFSSVWNLLTNYLKSGGQLDPSGAVPTSNDTTSSGDNGGQLDPSGTPK